ncbi:hypothetical protein GTA08_BOTSDO04403 [Neofusicoccum parvum]|nr:hypothetical protein GTA08_BOTSDO04403 [Neofusicoccum parvum]
MCHSCTDISDTVSVNNTVPKNYTLESGAETLISSEDLPYVIDNGYYWILATNRTLDNGVWRDCNATSSPTSSNDVGVGPNGTLWGTEEGTEANIYYPDSCIWVFNYTSAMPFREFLDNMIDGDALQYYAVPTAITGDLWLQNLYRNGTANMSTTDAFMEGLTISMTENIRTRGETPSTGYATGTPLASKTCIRVRWEWFALPIALWLLTVGFLVVLLLKSAFQSDSRLWWQKGTWNKSYIKAAVSDVSEVRFAPTLGSAQQSTL